MEVNCNNCFKANLANYLQDLKVAQLGNNEKAASNAYNRHPTPQKQANNLQPEAETTILPYKNKQTSYN
ncbi:MAG: hypothetical protein ACRCUJ_02080 [Phocaeicola sp.]